jgi:hypothetical protein
LVPANSFAEYAPEPNPATNVVRTQRRPGAVCVRRDMDDLQR